jgi:glycosyltransferase involved in cell wall biosynthesis
MLAILTSHPIQYQVPIWQQLARRNQVPFQVWYLSHHGVNAALDQDFGVHFRWDLDLLAGYSSRLLAPDFATSDITRFRGARLKNATRLFRTVLPSALLVLGWRLLADWQAVFMAHRRGIPVWLRAETNDLHRRPSCRDPLRRSALHHLFRRVDRFLSIGSANRRFYQSFAIPDQAILPAPYCVDHDRFAAAAKELAPRRAELRARWGIPTPARCLVFSGKLIPRKRPADLLRALELLGDPNLHLLIVGEGELRPALEQQSAQLRQRFGQDVVHFAGFLNQSEIPQAYAASDLLVLPSEYETWGLVANEALASGIPALVSDRCGCAEDLAARLGTSHVFRMGNPEELANSLRRVLTQPRSTEQSQAVSQSHHLMHTVDTVERLYRETASRKSGS